MAHYFITGCSSGIGRALVLHFARQGHTVHGTMRHPERDGDELRTLAHDEGLALHLVALDVTDETSVERAIGSATESAGPIDVLINNAGIAWLGSFEETPISWLEDTLATNVTGLARVTRAVVPSMRERRSGAIVNIGSVAGRIASAIQGHYCASKFAVEALTEALAQELYRFDIRVVLIEPGFIDTPLLDKAITVPEGSLEGPYAQLVRRRIELFRTGQKNAAPPEEVVEVVERALADPERRLRWFASENARPAVESREAMSDEDWIALGREMDDNEYAKVMGGRFDDDA